MKPLAAAALLALAATFGSLAWAQEPAPSLAAVFDVALVLDDSGSLSDAEFALERDFARSFVNSVNFGPTLVQAGVITFSTTARTIIDLSASKVSVLNAINGISPQNGGTCMPCGFDAAAQQFALNGRGSGTPQLTVFLTDGENNLRASEFAASLGSLQSASTVFAIGIGAVSQAQINDIASDLDGVQTAFFVNEFNSLSLLLGPLIENVALAVTPASAVPEPQSYALMLAGLALLGFTARRRRRARPISAKVLRPHHGIDLSWLPRRLVAQ